MAIDRMSDDGDEATFTATEIRRARAAEGIVVPYEPHLRNDDTAKQVRREQRRLAALAKAARR